MADVQHFSGTVTPVASTTSKCGLVVTPGAEPTVAEPGGIWYDTGDDCLIYYAPDGTKTYLPKGTGLAGQVLTSNGLDTVPTYQAHTPTPPGGADKQLQYNNATVFGGISNGNVGEVLISAGAGAIPAFGPHGRLLHGVVPPVDLTDGANGDFFLDTATSTLYGPKAGGAWPGGVSIIGATGAQGIQGIQGVPGTNGVFQKTTVNLSSAQILDLHNTAVELVPAPAAGSIIVVLGVFIYYHYGTVAYTIVGSCNVNIDYLPQAGSGDLYTHGISTNLEFGFDTLAIGTPAERLFQAGKAAAAVASSVVVKLGAGDQLTLGDGTMKVVTYYDTVSV